MANPLEKHFLLIHNNENQEVCKRLMNYIENEIVPNGNTDRKNHLHWMRLWGGRFYLIGTYENTIWTPEKIIKKIQKNVSSVHSVFVVEVQGMQHQGMMGADFWKFVGYINDFTKNSDNNFRFIKLKKIKSLIDKKEELKRKEIELKNREIEIFKKKEILNEEEELLKKEELIKKQEEELLEREKNLKKKKKFWGIF